MSYNFALIGAAGFVAPRHMKAIRDTGNVLKVALDPNDSVGIIDSYFSHSDFFVEFERFDRHVEKLRQKGENEKIHYVSICSPNYLHDSHIRFALRSGAHAICEKPVVLNPWNIDALMESEHQYGKKVNNILQLRLHPSIENFRNKVLASSEKKYEVELTYITSRGTWYHHSWKGNLEKSGGVATNIGVHFFDILTWIFGENIDSKIYLQDQSRSSGVFHFPRATVRWFLSIDERDLPESCKIKNKRTFRSLKCNEEEIEFSDGFEDLHSKSYQEILAGNGFSLKDASSSIKLAHAVRNATIQSKDGSVHPFLSLR